MSKCPCPKHQTQYINYIKFGDNASYFCCNECLVEEGYFFLDLIDIQKALKFSEELLLQFNKDKYQRELIKQFLKFNENHFRELIIDYENKVNDVKEKLFADLAKFKANSEILIKKWQTFRQYIDKITEHENFKQIITEFQSGNTKLNSNQFSKSEQSIHNYFKKMSQQNDYILNYGTQSSLQIKNQDVSMESFQGDIMKIRQKEVEIIQYSLNIHLLNFNLLNSPFLPTLEQQIISKINKKIKQYNSIYMSVKDGLQMNTLWDMIDGKDNLIMFFRSGSQNVFGGYSPCKWGKTINNQVQDSTLASFIFSQTNCQIFPLKSDCKQYAIYCGQQSYGPIFGDGSDLYLTSSFTVNVGTSGNKYENKTGQTIQLHGTATTILECEIYQVVFE